MMRESGERASWVPGDICSWCVLFRKSKDVVLLRWCEGAAFPDKSACARPLIFRILANLIFFDCMQISDYVRQSRKNSIEEATFKLGPEEAS